MCLYPKLITNPKYKANKKNGGTIPAILDKRVTQVPIGCGNCIECCKQKSNQWRTRLMEDIKTNTNAKFITLTFRMESIAELIEEIPAELEGYDIDNAIATIAVRRWLERHRKKYTKSIRHWLVTELGHNGTENIHLHGIIWADKIDDLDELWKYGYVWKGKMINGHLQNYVNEKTINYITKYVTKKDFKHMHYKPIILTSAGIGSTYTKTADGKKHIFSGITTKETYRTRTGHKIALPIYWRNQIYNDQEKEQLWIQKLDKNERWVLGVKIDISKGDKEYWNALKSAQETNKELGYGKNKNEAKDWEQYEYEKQLRNLKIKERIQAPSAGSIQKERIKSAKHSKTTSRK